MCLSYLYTCLLGLEFVCTPYEVAEHNELLSSHLHVLCNIYVMLVYCRKGGVAGRLCSGAVIAVPENMKEGLDIMVNTLSESYMSRV